MFVEEKLKEISLNQELKEKALKWLQNKNKNCRGCDIKKDYQEHLAVPGHGSCNAGIFIVGEAPGNDEMLAGKPFVGRAGKKLDEAIEEAGLNRDELYIHNILSCRPLDNKFPHHKTKEIQICRNWLTAELGIIRPKVVIAVGKVPYEYLLGLKNTRITNERGVQIPWYIKELDLKTILIPTLHPSYCMRKVNMGDNHPYECMVQDLALAKKINKESI